MSGLVSIIIPSVNEKFLERCLESLFNQTYKNIEVILVDDDSDKYGAFVYKKYKDDIKIKVNPIRLGTSECRNIGYSMIDSKSEYVMFHDDDDVSLPDKIETLVRYLENNEDVDFVGSMFEFIDATDKDIKFDSIAKKGNWFRRSTHYKSIYYTSHLINHFVPSTVLIRRDVCDLSLPFKHYFDEDYEFFNRMLMNGYVGCNINDVLTKKRITPESKTNNRTSASNKETDDIIRRKYELFLYNQKQNKKSVAVILKSDDVSGIKKFINNINKHFLCDHKKTIFIITECKISNIDGSVIVISDYDTGTVYENIEEYGNVLYNFDYVFLFKKPCVIREHVMDEVLNVLTFSGIHTTAESNSYFMGGQSIEFLRFINCLFTSSDSDDFIYNYSKENNGVVLDDGYSVYCDMDNAKYITKIDFT